METMSYDQWSKEPGMFSLKKRRLEWFRGGEWGAWSILQPSILEEFSFGQGIDLLCSVVKDGRKIMIRNWKEGKFWSIHVIVCF